MSYPLSSSSQGMKVAEDSVSHGIPPVLLSHFERAASTRLLHFPEVYNN